MARFDNQTVILLMTAAGIGEGNRCCGVGLKQQKFRLGYCIIFFVTGTSVGDRYRQIVATRLGIDSQRVSLIAVDNRIVESGSGRAASGPSRLSQQQDQEQTQQNKACTPSGDNPAAREVVQDVL